MFFLIGIDDTDTTAAIGADDTGALAIRLGLSIQERRFGRLLSVTRHQLLRHPDIPLTTDNNAVCLLIDADTDARRDIELTCREVLLRSSAPSSDPGFALAAWNNLSSAVEVWGQQAKHARLQRRLAVELARSQNIAAAGFHGNGDGVIGALAAVGLRSSGNDGRFIWLPGLDGVKGVLTLPALLNLCAIDRVENFRGRAPLERELIDLGESPMVMLRNNQSLLLLDACGREDACQWRVVNPEDLNPVSP